MGYPISNLRKDFQDINLDNAEYVARYLTLLLDALFSKTDETLSRVPTLDDASEYYNANKNNLNPVIFNAEVLNNFAQYVEDLKNYTIAVKNQIFFCDINISNEEFDKLYGDIAEGDVIVYTDTQDEYTIFKSIMVKQGDGSYQTVIKFGNSTYYIEITDDDIYSLEETGEIFGIEYTPTSSANISPLIYNISSGNYIDLSNISYITNGDVVSINYLASSMEINYFKINEKFYFINSSSNKYGVLFARYAVKDFVFCQDGASNITTPITGGYYNGLLTYDNEGNILNKNTSIFTDKGINDTGWVNCTLDTSVVSAYKTSTDSSGSSYPQVRRIEDTVHLRGVIKGEKISKYASFNLPSSMFYPSKTESFVQHEGYLEDDEQYFDSSSSSDCMRISTNGEVLITRLDAGAITPGIALNCSATWFVN